MIPFQGDGGNYVIFAQWHLPGRPPADDNDISAVLADVVNAQDGTVLADNVALTYSAARKGWFATRPVTDLNGAREIQTTFTPTSGNVLIQPFTTDPRAVADILIRQDAIETKIDDLDADLVTHEANRAAMETTLVAEHDSTQSQLATHDTDQDAEHATTRSLITTETDALDAAVADLDADLVTHDTDIKALLNNASYGLAALKALLDTLQNDESQILAAIETFKGAGWDINTDTLEKIRDLLDIIDANTPDRTGAARYD